MDRQTLVASLERLTRGKILAQEGSTYRVQEGHRLTFYIGQPGQAMVVKDITVVELDDALCALEKTDANDTSTLLVPAEEVHAIRHYPPQAKDDRRAGFA